MSRMLLVLLMPFVLSCTDFKRRVMCSYVDAFGAGVSEEALTFQKGRSDAEKAYSEGRLIVIEGYNGNEQFT